MIKGNNEKRGCLPKLENYWMSGFYFDSAGLYLIFTAKSEQELLLGSSLVILGTSIIGRDLVDGIKKIKRRN